MCDNLPLDSFLQTYHEGKIDKKELEGIIFDYILKNGAKFGLGRWPEDECIDFLSWFYPRIGRAIDKYRDVGSSFDAYMSTIILWASKEYIRVETSHRMLEQTYWDMRTQEIAVHEHEPAYGDRAAPFKPVNNPRQALMLLLKSYYFVSEDFIDRAAPAIGIEKERLKSFIEQLRNLRIHRDDAIKGTRDRMHTLYYRCISLERRVNAALPGSARYEKIKSRLERARSQLSAMRIRFKRMRTKATNQQVALVLGIPKGTIDSNLFAIKVKSKYDENGGEKIFRR
ncbi:MAG: hypothetical protein LBE17_02345 [Treponema sp.]|jgi:hypothetical protein|nr:hypothetical protein [Treponema sp.]